MTIAIDVSKLPMLAERQKALEDQLLIEKIQEEEEAAVSALEAKYNAERRRIHGEYQKQLDEVLNPLSVELEKIRAPFNDRITKLSGSEGFRINYDYDCRLVLCALSGLPILEEEAVLEDDKTGGQIIRALLPFPIEPVFDDATDEVPA